MPDTKVPVRWDLNPFYHGCDTIPASALEIVLSWLARFNRYEFFTKELYKKSKHYKTQGIRRDRSEIQVAFVTKALYEHGIYTTPCGVAWACLWNSPEQTQEYLAKYAPFFEAYEAWANSQR